MIEFGQITGGEKHISRGSAMPTSQGGGAPASPNLFGTPCLRRNRLSTATKFVAETYVGSSVFLGVSHARISGAEPHQRSQFGGGDFPTYTQTLWPVDYRLPRLGAVRRGTQRISTGLGAPPFQGAHPNVFNYFGTPMYASTVQPTGTKFGMVTPVGSVFQPRHHPKRAGRQRPQRFLDPAHLHPNGLI